MRDDDIDEFDDVLERGPLSSPLGSDGRPRKDGRILPTQAEHDNRAAAYESRMWRRGRNG